MLQKTDNLSSSMDLVVDVIVYRGEWVSKSIDHIGEMLVCATFHATLIIP